ncbi:response regulator [Campylobacter concisus]|uniref:response regulator n=1 Tax=Campylobacter concisus TaxID=199 RepID=UPI000CD7F14E|nr:response regulator [Campylobacter concisus]
MKILIVENEIYLAGSMASKLADFGYDCEIAKSVKEALKFENFDVVLLSTTLPGQDFYPVIEKFKSSIIILLIAYINSDTVLKPIQAGAVDYIQKPFMIEELVRKIRHFEEFKGFKNEIKNYENYINFALKDYEIPCFEAKKIKFPLLLKSSKNGYSDKFIFNYVKAGNLPFLFLGKACFSELEKALAQSGDELIYITNLEELKEDEKEKILELCKKKKVAIQTSDFAQSAPFEELELSVRDKNFDIGEIVTIDEYIKYIIVNYQDKFPDTELSKKLGISRKSLWEKRKKYDVSKKK